MAGINTTGSGSNGKYTGGINVTGDYKPGSVRIDPPKWKREQIARQKRASVRKAPSAFDAGYNSENVGTPLQLSEDERHRRGVDEESKGIGSDERKARRRAESQGTRLDEQMVYLEGRIDSDGVVHRSGRASFITDKKTPEWYEAQGYLTTRSGHTEQSVFKQKIDRAFSLVDDNGVISGSEKDDWVMSKDPNTKSERITALKDKDGEYIRFD